MSGRKNERANACVASRCAQLLGGATYTIDPIECGGAALYLHHVGEVTHEVGLTAAAQLVAHFGAGGLQ